MFRFALTKKLREIVTELYLDNWVLLGQNGAFGDWNENWMVKSFNETLQTIHKIAQDTNNLKLQTKIDLIPIQLTGLVDDIDNPNMFDAYTCAYYIYFDERPSINELNKFRYFFKSEK
jgi:hypothetical protein